MLTGNLAHQLLLAVTTATSLGLAPCLTGSASSAREAVTARPAVIMSAHKMPCPLSHRAVIAARREKTANIIEASASVSPRTFRATITVNW